MYSSIQVCLSKKRNYTVGLYYQDIGGGCGATRALPRDGGARGWVAP